MSWDYILILAFLVFIIPWRSNARVRALLEAPPLSSFGRMSLYFSTIAVQWLLALVILWRSRVHHVALASLGISLPNPRRALIAAAVLAVLLVLNQVFGLHRLASLPAEQRGIIPRLADKLLPRSRLETLVAVLLVISVAICEELIYRGFVQTIFQDLLASSALAGAGISALLFSLAHLYQGRKGLITTFVVGLIFSLVRIWTGSLFPCIFIHFCVDFAAGVVAARLPGLQAAIILEERGTS